MNWFSHSSRTALVAALLLGWSPAGLGKESVPAPAPETSFLRTLKPKVPVFISNPNLTFQVGMRLPLFQQNDVYFIALTSTDYEAPRLVALPRESRGGRLAWVSSEQTLIFAYPATTCEGLFYLREGEKLPVARETETDYEATIERFGRRASLLVSKTTPDIEYRKDVPLAIAPAQPASDRGLKAVLRMVTNQEGRVSLFLDPAVTGRLDHLRVVTPRLPVPIINPLVTFHIGDDLPLFQQNETDFIALVNTEYEGLRLCAFPIALQYARSAWVTPEKSIIFAYTVSSRDGTMYLRQGEELPIVGETPHSYLVVMERFGRHARMTISKGTDGFRYVKAPPPPPPEKPRTVRVVKIVASGPQTFTNAPTTIAKGPLGAITSAPPAAAQEERNLVTRVGDMFSRLISRTPPTTNVPAAVPATSQVAAAVPPPPKGPAITAPPPPSTAAAVAPVQTSETPPNPLLKTRDNLAALLLAFVTGHPQTLGIGVAIVLLASGLAIRGRRLSEVAPTEAEAEAEKPAAGAAAAAAPAPTAPAEAAPSTPPMVMVVPADFSGSIASMSLGAVTQFLNSDKETGVLTIKDERGTELGRIVFIKGDIVDAQSPGKRGVDAVYDILRHRQGQFSFVRGAQKKVQETVKQGTISLLLDAHRIMDEKAPPAPAPAPSAKPIGMPKRGGSARR